jgi:hypothetical protein
MSNTTNQEHNDEANINRTLRVIDTSASNALHRSSTSTTFDSDMSALAKCCDNFCKVDGEDDDANTTTTTPTPTPAPTPKTTTTTTTATATVTVTATTTTTATTHAFEWRSNAAIRPSAARR